MEGGGGGTTEIAGTSGGCKEEAPSRSRHGKKCFKRCALCFVPCSLCAFREYHCVSSAVVFEQFLTCSSTCDRRDVRASWNPRPEAMVAHNVDTSAPCRTPPNTTPDPSANTMDKKSKQNVLATILHVNRLVGGRRARGGGLRLTLVWGKKRGRTGLKLGTSYRSTIFPRKLAFPLTMIFRVRPVQ